MKKMSKCEKFELIIGSSIGILFRAGLSAAAVGLTVSEVLKKFNVQENIIDTWFRIGLVIGTSIQVFMLMGGRPLNEKDMLDKEKDSRRSWRMVSLASSHPVGALQLACCGIFKQSKKVAEGKGESHSIDIMKPLLPENPTQKQKIEPHR